MKNRGSSSIVAMVVIAVLTVSFSAGMWVVSILNSAATVEEKLNAVLLDNKQTLGSYTVKIKEMMQVPDAYRADLERIIDATFKGRYGKDGSNAVVQLMQEANLQLDPAMYSKVQVAMEAGRNEFQAKQMYMIDIARQYRTDLRTIPSSLILVFFGYPKIDLDQFKPLTSQQSEDNYKSGMLTGVEIR